MPDGDHPDDHGAADIPITPNSALGWWLSLVMTFAYGGFLLAGAFANRLGLVHG